MSHRERRSYGRIEEVLPPPYLLRDIRESFRKFIDEGIKRSFADVSPIVGHGKDGLSLELINPYLGEARNT